MSAAAGAAKGTRAVCALDVEREDAMVRDLLILATASIVLGVIVWIILGNSQKRFSQGSSLRAETSHSLSADRDLRLVSERSPYMRTER